MKELMRLKQKCPLAILCLVASTVVYSQEQRESYIRHTSELIRDLDSIESGFVGTWKLKRFDELEYGDSLFSEFIPDGPAEMYTFYDDGTFTESRIIDGKIQADSGLWFVLPTEDFPGLVLLKFDSNERIYTDEGSDEYVVFYKSDGGDVTFIDSDNLQFVRDDSWTHGQSKIYFYERKRTKR